jgi:hypothetical protein
VTQIAAAAPIPIATMVILQVSPQTSLQLQLGFEAGFQPLTLSPPIISTRFDHHFLQLLTPRLPHSVWQ